MPQKKEWASSLAEAKRNAVVNMQAGSGTRYSVRPLTLDELAAEDGLPDDLLRVALLEMIPGGVVGELAGKLQDGDSDAARKLSEDIVGLRDRIVLKAVVAPALKPKDLPQLDPYDKAEIAAVAQRRLTVDEEGRIVAGGLATFREADPLQ